MCEHSYAAFGLRLGAPVPLALRPDDGAARPAVAVRLLAEHELAARWSGPVRRLWEADRDGTAVSVERGRAGDHRICAEGVATFVLAADGSELACATDGDRERDWRRMLEELALPCTSLLLGHEALHAGAVALADGGAVALLAPSGGGKSTLAAALLDAGGELLSDDVLVLRGDGERIVAEPAAPTLKRASADGGAETRTALSAGALAARPLTLIVVLARGAAGAAPEQPRLDPLDGPMPVLTHALSLPSTPARAAARLALYGDLLARTPAVRLVADMRDTPAQLAELIATAAGAREAVLA